MDCLMLLQTCVRSSCFSHRFATTSSSPTCGRPTSPAASHTGLQQHQAVQPVVGQHHQLLLTQVCNNIKQSNLWSANITSCFSHRFATTSSSPTCGRPTSPAASLTGLQQHQAV